MGEHDKVREEEGFVVCRCGKTWCRESTGEALALWRQHAKTETVDKPGAGEARASLTRALLKQEDGTDA